MKSPERFEIFAQEFASMITDANSPNFAAVLHDVKQADTLESICEAIKRLAPDDDQTAELMRALLAGHTGDHSVDLDECRGNIEHDLNKEKQRAAQDAFERQFEGVRALQHLQARK